MIKISKNSRKLLSPNPKFEFVTNTHIVPVLISNHDATSGNVILTGKKVWLKGDTCTFVMVQSSAYSLLQEFAEPHLILLGGHNFALHRNYVKFCGLLSTVNVMMLTVYLFIELNYSFVE